MAIKLFGFTLGKQDVVQVESPEQRSFALPTEAIDDGAVTITSNAYYGTSVVLPTPIIPPCCGSKREIGTFSEFKSFCLK